ncbi:MAG: SAM-dependent chlorinase/fluorinase [Candidatus Bathyarchaeota archaeon]|nr:SAM-dependent chlorinase/fluorinase [Candidatus Bathyarchaeota archaeon]
MKHVITLTTDFGYRDPYVACMKGVILSICPNATIIDVTHDVSKFDVEEAAYILYRAYSFFPSGTIHVCVVDPGVGTERRPIAIESKRYIFIGPDNGVLTLAAEDDGIEGVYVIESRHVMLGEVSFTFHGRDIFAPTAAWIALGYPLEMLGRSVEDIERVRLATPLIDGNRLRGKIIYVDSYGNLVTNVRWDLIKGRVAFGDTVKLSYRDREVYASISKAYGEVPLGELLLIPGSGGFMEISMNMGDASKKLDLKRGDYVYLEFM